MTYREDTVKSRCVFSGCLTLIRHHSGDTPGTPFYSQIECRSVTPLPRSIASAVRALVKTQRLSYSMHDFLRDLADVILSGPLTREEIAVRMQSALRPMSPEAEGIEVRQWTELLATEICEHFPARLLPPRKRQLVDFLQSRMPAPIIEFFEIDSSPCSISAFHPLAPQFADWNLPPIDNTGSLAKWLQIEPSQLNWLTSRESRPQRNPVFHRYSIRIESQENGKRRVLEVPCPALIRAQRQILNEMLNRVSVHDAAHGFCKGRSTLTAVHPHQGQTVAWKLDLANFFMSIQRQRVCGLFRLMGYPDEVANSLAALTTNGLSKPHVERIGKLLNADQRAALTRWGPAWHLPQGAPTSPAIANLLAYRLDCRLTGLASKFSGNYTRYADDLLFSGGVEFRKQLPAFRIWAQSIILNEGFAVQHQKSRVMRSTRRQHALGIVFNNKLNVDRNVYKTLHAILHNCIQHGPESQNRDAIIDFRSHLQGRISYIRQLNPPRAEKLQTMMDRIEWN